MSSNGISGLDHLVVVVRDLGVARDTYSRLGFTVTPRGRYPELRASGHSVLFGSGPFIELLAIEEQRPVNAHYAAFLRQREGLAALALKTPDVPGAWAALADAGFPAADPSELHLIEESAEGVDEARYTIAQLDAKAVPGGRFVLCHRHNPDPVPEREHANGALGIAAVVIAADDPEPVAATYARLFGSTVEQHGPARLVRTGDVALLIATPDRLHWAWTSDPVLTAPRPFLAGAVFRIADTDRAQQALQKSKFPTVVGNGVLRVGSAGGCGLTLAFAQEFDLSALIP